MSNIAIVYCKELLATTPPVVFDDPDIDDNLVPATVAAEELCKAMPGYIFGVYLATLDANYQGTYTPASVIVAPL